MTGSRRGGCPRRIRRDGLALALMLASACASPAAPEVSWDARLAEGDLVRASEAEAAGDREHALELGRGALRRARDAAALGTVGRALLFVGRTEPDLGTCLDAVAVFQHVGDRSGEVEAHLAAAELLHALAQDGDALDELRAAESVLELDRAVLDRRAWAQVDARLQHQAAEVLRAQGRHEEAAGRERRAELALSLLADDQLLGLQREVQLALAADEVAAGWPDRAIERYNRALFLARRDGDREAELEAMTGVVDSLAALGRVADAVSHCERALALARELPDPERVQALGRRGLQLLQELGEADGSARRRSFEDALLWGS